MSIAVLLALHVVVAVYMPGSPLRLLPALLHLSSASSTATPASSTAVISQSPQPPLPPPPQEAGEGERIAGQSAPCTLARPVRSRLETRDGLRAVMADVQHSLVYVPSASAVLMTMGKAGTSTLWNTIYFAMEGRLWDGAICGISHNKSSPCWNGLATYVDALPEDEQWRVMTHPDVLRIALQREPLSRLLSAYKNKYTCEAELFNTEIRGTQMHILRRHANLPVGPPCMNVSDFADALERMRLHVGEGHGFVKELRMTDVHIRPQQYLFEDIEYQLVLDVKDVANRTKVEPLFKHFEHSDEAFQQNFHRHDSGNYQLVMTEHTAQQLHDWAQLSAPGELRYLS